MKAAEKKAPKAKPEKAPAKAPKAPKPQAPKEGEGDPAPKKAALAEARAEQLESEKTVTISRVELERVLLSIAEATRTEGQSISPAAYDAIQSNLDMIFGLDVEKIKA